MAKLLIVDDNEDSLARLRLHLVGQGFEVITARDGVACLQRAVEDRPDAILLDVVMPGMDGVEVCRQLKADGDTESIPVLMLSGGGEWERAAAALRAGALECVTKPVDAPGVAARVRLVLGIGPARAAAARP